MRRLPKFPDTAVLVTPVYEADNRGNKKLTYKTPPATASEPFNAWLQQDSTADIAEDGRTPTVMTWLLMAEIPELTITGIERIRCRGLEFEIFGVPEVCNTLKGYHHTEMRLKRIDG
ncbi:hypothetical protein ACFQS3_02635 [Glycomyces mayteni]|uniref:Head-tail adaptor protein n=1 Tax=Glycomyces mayteni TaxID=543887 RepID=A0ABW2D511_9ACTN|nr:hypothetical protein GCM10025732_48280 [Glycomyces mayteni]